VSSTEPILKLNKSIGNHSTTIVWTTYCSIKQPEPPLGHDDFLPILKKTIKISQSEHISTKGAHYWERDKAAGSVCSTEFVLVTDFGSASTRSGQSHCSCAKSVAEALWAAEKVVDADPVGFVAAALQTFRCREEKGILPPKN
jgi:hypothetical protein